MKINQLEKASIAAVRNTLSQLPRSQNYIEFEGSFTNLEIYHVLDAFIYLPRHIKEARFVVQYYYTTQERKIDSCRHSPNGIPSYTTFYSYTQRIGEALQSYVAALPSTINKIIFDFIANDHVNFYGFCSADLANMVARLPYNVRELNFGSGVNWSSNAFKTIPNSIKKLTPGYLKLDLLKPKKCKTLLSKINRETTYLSLKNNQLSNLPAQSLPYFIEGLPLNLTSLNLSANHLSQKQINELASFFHALSALQELRFLGLGDNQFSNYIPFEFAEALRQLSPMLNELDLGENGLLSLSIDDFKTILAALHNTITTLRVCERHANGLSKEKVSMLLACMASHVKWLSFSNSQLMGFSVVDFLFILRHLPSTVEGIDLSFNDLNPDDLIYLVSHLPPPIRRLKMRGNGLCCLDVKSLKTLFSSISPSIEELDISDNDVDRLPYSNIQDILQAIPSSVHYLLTGVDEFKLNDEGSFAPAPRLSQTGLFKPHNCFSHHIEFAKLRIILMHVSMVMDFFGFPFAVAKKIFDNIFCNATEGDILKYMALSFNQIIISSAPPIEITPEHEKQSLLTIEQRIRHLKPNDFSLDLSRCGLNRLESMCSHEIFTRFLNSLHRITHLKLRSNGFLLDNRSIQIFNQLIQNMPASIECLDLSDNGFEFQSAESLKLLFQSLPPSIKNVILHHELALPPKHHIAHRTWPAKYLKITQDIEDCLGIARKLLDEYTLGDSTFLRFVCLQWSRNYTAIAARLVYFIDKGLITEIEDLNLGVEEINVFSNPESSLAKRFCFWMYQRNESKKQMLESNMLNNNKN